MGSHESKSADQSPKQNDKIKESELNDSLPSTPILTPLDPRSPSTNIARTPLELILGSKISNVNSANITEDNCEEVIKNVILNVDPRSPTVEFTRTPIIVSTVVKEKPTILNNKNFDNVRKSMIQTTPTSIRTSNIIPPKLLGSSPLTINPNMNKRRSLVGLLETNIDFTETNLDDVCTNQDTLNNTSPTEISEECVNSRTDELENELESLNLQTLPDPKLILDQPPNDENNECESTNENVKKKIENCIQEAELKITESNGDSGSIMEEKVINITAHVKDFDKKLTNLIYQDESEDDGNKLAARFAKMKDNSRTPLGVRNSNEEPKKPSSKLKVSDKPRKTEISKIPVLKDTKKLGIQCENTPPNKAEDNRIKPKISHWDGDKTMII